MVCNMEMVMCDNESRAPRAHIKVALGRRVLSNNRHVDLYHTDFKRACPEKEELTVAKQDEVTAHNVEARRHAMRVSWCSSLVDGTRHV